ncbi:MAG: hypothetical protein JNK47_03930 [Mesorhizobium sp.]|nr:hypothetical protein [Mesorhizobium sp.]MBL8576351.1 hypothetical protein [Mesorhizobium sp.]
MKDPLDSLRLRWGSKNIALSMGRPERTVAYMLEAGQIPGARKINGRWCVSDFALERLFEIDGPAEFNEATLAQSLQHVRKTLERLSREAADRLKSGSQIASNLAEIAQSIKSVEQEVVV